MTPESLAGQEWIAQPFDDDFMFIEDGDGNIILDDVPIELAQAIAALPKLYAACLRAEQAIHLTREYVGENILPEIEGWEWFDAMKQLQAALDAATCADEQATE